MIRSTQPGRILLAVAIAAFGVQYLLAVANVVPAPGPPWPAAVPPIVVGIAGILLLALALCLGLTRLASRAAAGVALALFLTACVDTLPKLFAAPRKPGPWTSSFELLAMCGGALVLAATLWKRPLADSPTFGQGSSLAALPLAGRLLFAVSLGVFAVQHFLYGPFIAALLPGWIPAHLFWAYFVGVAFAAAALSLATGIQARLAGTLLGWMFLLWVVCLHLPRCFASPHNGNEWTSAIVALAMGGCAWILAGA